MRNTKQSKQGARSPQTQTHGVARHGWVVGWCLALSMGAVGCASTKADRITARPDADAALADQVRDLELPEHEVGSGAPPAGTDEVELALADTPHEVVEVEPAEPTVTEPTVTEPTVTEPTVTEPTVPGRTDRIALPDSRDPLAGLL